MSEGWKWVLCLCTATLTAFAFGHFLQITNRAFVLYGRKTILVGIILGAAYVLCVLVIVLAIWSAL